MGSSICVLLLPSVPVCKENSLFGLGRAAYSKPQRDVGCLRVPGSPIVEIVKMYELVGLLVFF